MDSTALRAWMTQHSYSVRTLAAALDLAPATIQRYRDGTYEVPRTVELALLGLMLEDAAERERLAEHAT